MSNKNTRKVRARRQRRGRERAMKEVLAFLAKRNVYITLGDVCNTPEGGEWIDCYCQQLSVIAAYSFRQVVENYTDCILLPGADFMGYTVFHPIDEAKGYDDNTRQPVNMDWDKYFHMFGKPHIEALRDYCLSQLAVIKEKAWLDDAQWDYVRRHVVFFFSENLEKSRSLVKI